MKRDLTTREMNLLFTHMEIFWEHADTKSFDGYELFQQYCMWSRQTITDKWAGDIALWFEMRSISPDEKIQAIMANDPNTPKFTLKEDDIEWLKQVQKMFRQQKQEDMNRKSE